MLARSLVLLGSAVGAAVAQTGGSVPVAGGNCGAVSSMVAVLRMIPDSPTYCSSVLGLSTVTTVTTTTLILSSTSTVVTPSTISETETVTTTLATSSLTVVTPPVITSVATKISTVTTTACGGAAAPALAAPAAPAAPAIAAPAGPKVKRQGASSFCQNAPIPLQNFFYAQVSAACGCLGLTPTTVTSITTVSTTTIVFTPSASLTYITLTSTVPVTTTAIITSTAPAPLTTVTSSVTATASYCPCTATQSLCPNGSCVDLRNDPKNCGTCGNTCTSGLCLAGTCAPCQPRNCQTFSQGPCNAQGVCYCLKGSGDKVICGDLTKNTCDQYILCNVDSDCGAGNICTHETCCAWAYGVGLCVSQNSCGNAASPKVLFARRLPRGSELPAGGVQRPGLPAGPHEVLGIP